MNSLEEIAELVRSCADCPLSQGRTHAVPGEGASDARVIFIGEAPGYQEDQQGRPFVGPAGRFLDELLGTIGLKREDVFIANMVKCRPPKNRDPLPTEVAACTKYLDRQIELLRPDLIVTLGRYAMGKYFPKESISRVRGKVRTKDGQRILPLMHPAAALHQANLRDSIEQDFKVIPQAIEEATQQSQAGSPQAELPQANALQAELPQASPSQASVPQTSPHQATPASPPDRQLSMF
jgi:DNA polymerase